jgi:hypothetical protein
MTEATTAEGRLIGKCELARLLGVQLHTLDAWVRLGRFPPPVPGIGVRARWDRVVVEAALAGKWNGPAATEKVGPRRRSAGR